MKLFKIITDDGKIYIYYNKENLYVKLKQDKYKKVTSLSNNSPQEEILDFLNEAKLKINEDTLKEIDKIFKKFLDESKDHICNLCKHYSLLNGFCNKINKQLKKNDSCNDWEN